MKTYKMLSVLLDYPDQELIDSLPVFRKRLDGLEDADAEERVAVRRFLDWLGQGDLIRIQEDYVKTFDLTPEHSLHLTHHFFGDDNDRNRGPALIDLGELYRDYGVEPTGGELPDYLPLILEFASMLEDTEAIAFLSDANKVLTLLADNLASAGSPYAPLLSIVKSRATLTRLAA